jgi:hypothetical protein
MTAGNEPNAPSPPDLDEGETPASGSAAAAKPLTATDSFTPLIDVNAFSSSREFPTVETFAVETSAAAGSESFRVETWSVEASFGKPPEEQPLSERDSRDESSIAGPSVLNETPGRGSSADEVSFGETSTDEKSFGGASADEVSFGETSTDGKSFGGASADEVSFGETSTDEKSFGGASADDISFGETSTDGKSFGGASADEVSFSEISIDEKSFGGASADEISFSETPYDETALGQTSVGEASVNAASSGVSALSETVSGRDSRAGEGVLSMPILPPDTVLRSNQTPSKDDASTGGAHQKRYDSKSVPHFDGRTIVSNQGCIAFLMMPNKFVLANHSETEFYSVHEYQVLNYPSMKIGHWEWSRPASQFSDEVAAGFKATLELEPHVLTPEEMEVLEDVIPLEVFGYNGAFDLIALRTEDYSGKTVLVLEVKWWDVDRKAYGMFFSTDESYKFLESVHFEGTEGDYRRNFLSAKASFMRMRWRT